MTGKAELVDQFKQVVEGVLAESIKDTPRSVSWPGKGNEASFGSLQYIKAQPYTMRPREIGLDGARWGVIQRRLRVGNYSGSLALVAVSSKKTALERRWSFDSPMSPVEIVLKKDIDQTDELQAAVAWARSPQLEFSNITQLTMLSPSEEEDLHEQYREAQQSAQQLSQDLERLSRARRRPLPDIWLS